jgi:hypothetical protein
MTHCIKQWIFHFISLLRRKETKRSLNRRNKKVKNEKKNNNLKEHLPYIQIFKSYLQL